MNSLKKAIKALREYLGRDVNGLRLLDDVARDVTAMRHRLQEAEERRSSSERVALALQDRLSKTTQRADELQDELARQISICKQQNSRMEILNSDLSDLRSQLEAIIGEDIAPPDGVSTSPRQRTSAEFVCPKDSFIGDFQSIVDMFNCLRRSMRVAPKPAGTWVELKHDKVPVYQLSDIVQSFAGHELMTLGRFVASLACMNLPCIIVCNEATEPSQCFRKNESRYEPELLAPFVYWFRRSIDTKSDAWLYGHQLPLN